MFDFRFNIPILSLNQDQGSVFKVRECAQSIPRIKLLLEGHLLKNFFLIFYPDPVLDFRLKKSAIFGGVLHGKMVSEKNENIHLAKSSRISEEMVHSPWEQKKNLSPSKPLSSIFRIKNKTKNRKRPKPRLRPKTKPRIRPKTKPRLKPVLGLSLKD